VFVGLVPVGVVTVTSAVVPFVPGGLVAWIKLSPMTKNWAFDNGYVYRRTAGPRGARHLNQVIADGEEAETEAEAAAATAAAAIRTSLTQGFAGHGPPGARRRGLVREPDSTDREAGAVCTGTSV
jgi:hypothetical protein